VFQMAKQFFLSTLGQSVSPQSCHQAAVGPQKVLTEQAQQHMTAMLHPYSCM